jgi:putative transposase
MLITSVSPRQGWLVRRSFKFLLRPTAHQEIALTACLDDHRALYNAALEERREAYKRCKVSVRYGDQSAQLKDIRKDDVLGQGRWSGLHRQDRQSVAAARL